MFRCCLGMRCNFLWCWIPIPISKCVSMFTLGYIKFIERKFWLRINLSDFRPFSTFEERAHLGARQEDWMIIVVKKKIRTLGIFAVLSTYPILSNFSWRSNIEPPRYTRSILWLNGLTLPHSLTLSICEHTFEWKSVCRTGEEESCLKLNLFAHVVIETHFKGKCVKSTATFIFKLIQSDCVKEYKEREHHKHSNYSVYLYLCPYACESVRVLLFLLLLFMHNVIGRNYGYVIFITFFSFNSYLLYIRWMALIPKLIVMSVRQWYRKAVIKA